jgi:hypothetical protein
VPRPPMEFTGRYSIFAKNSCGQNHNTAAITPSQQSRTRSRSRSPRALRRVTAFPHRARIRRVAGAPPTGSRRSAKVKASKAARALARPFGHDHRVVAETILQTTLARSSSPPRR